ncbi:hypothetical protein ACWGJX_38035 [Streptomyces sp. NPDC054775]
MVDALSGQGGQGAGGGADREFPTQGDGEVRRYQPAEFVQDPADDAAERAHLEGLQRVRSRPVVAVTVEELQALHRKVSAFHERDPADDRRNQ